MTSRHFGGGRGRGRFRKQSKAGSSYSTGNSVTFKNEGKLKTKTFQCNFIHIHSSKVKLFLRAIDLLQEH